MKSNFPVISSPPTTRFTPLHLLGKLNTLTKYLPLSLCFLPTPLLAQTARKRTYNSFSNPSWLWGINLGSLAHSLTRFTPNILLPECTKNRQLHFAHVKFFPPVLLFFLPPSIFRFLAFIPILWFCPNLVGPAFEFAFAIFFLLPLSKESPNNSPVYNRHSPRKWGRSRGRSRDPTQSSRHVKLSGDDGGRGDTSPWICIVRERLGTSRGGNDRKDDLNDLSVLPIAQLFSHFKSLWRWSHDTKTLASLSIT